MTLCLLIDTETTGLVKRELRSDDPAQPHLVELGAILFDADERKIRSQVSLIVRPDGWTIPDGAAEVHGIDTNTAYRCGLPMDTVIDVFASLVSGAQEIMAYNLPFDRRIMRTAWLRTGRSRDGFDAIFDWFGDGMNAMKPGRCVMNACTPVVNLPPTEKMLRAGFNKPKTPNLTEAYRHFFGQPFQGAHGALADCHATLAIHWKMNETTQPAERSALPASAGEDRASGRAPDSSPAMDRGVA